MINLSPCPFCGSSDISLKKKRYHGGVVEIKGHRFWFVECLPCDARTGYCFDGDSQDGDGAKAAIDAWNRRLPTESDR